ASLSAMSHWDGEFKGVDALVRSRLVGQAVYYGGPPVITPPDPSTLPPVEASVVRAPHPLNLSAIETRYREAFEAAGVSHLDVQALIDAITVYCDSIRSGDSPFDRFGRGERDAMSASAKRGFLLFVGRAGCVNCHRVYGARATFTDDQFHATGVAWHAAIRSASSEETGADRTPAKATATTAV